MEQADEIDAAPFFTYSCQIKYLGHTGCYILSCAKHGNCPVVIIIMK